MRLPEYDRLDALALADLVRRGEVGAAELLEAALERAGARNPRLNAIVARYDDEARARARGPLPPGPVSGVPFLLKDLYSEWSGHPVTGSTRLLAARIATRDSDVVSRLLRAGVVIFGQTNTPELGNTMLFKQTGQPAMSVPLHVTATGLPLGVQVPARSATRRRCSGSRRSSRRRTQWADRMPPER